MTKRMAYFIRPAEKTDTAFLREMLYQSVFVPPGEQMPPRSILEEPSIAHYLEDWGRPHDLALLAVNPAGEPLGAVWIRLFTAQDPGYGFIDEKTPELGMALLRQYRGHGIGRKLLFAMMEMARRSGFSALSLSVDPQNQAALRLYETSGFVRSGPETGGSWTMRVQL